MFALLQDAVIIIISYAAFVGGVWALIDAARTPEAAFTTAGKQSKTLWVVLTVCATAVLFISLPFPFGSGSGPLWFVGIGAIAVVIIYHVGVKPAVAPYRGMKGPRGPSGRGGW